MSFIMSLSETELADYCFKQIEYFFPDGQFGMSRHAALDLVHQAMPKAVARLEECLGSINAPNYHDANGNVLFSHLHADHYATFLYFLENTIWSKYIACNMILLIFLAFKTVVSTSYTAKSATYNGSHFVINTM